MATKKPVPPPVIPSGPCKWHPPREQPADGSIPEPPEGEVTCGGTVRITLGERDTFCTEMLGHKHHVFADGSYIYEAR